jgi:hypothetical protein
MFESKRTAETRRLDVNFSDSLAADEELSGTVTVREIGTSDLTITNAEVNDVDVFIGHRNSIKNRSISCFIAGGLAGNEYTVRITVSTDDGQTLIAVRSFRVN